MGGYISAYRDLDKLSDVKISLKVCAVQIKRPWLDMSVLHEKYFKIPGENPGSWSTGELDSSNNGSFPMFATQMIVAKDISVTTSGTMEHKAIAEVFSLVS